MMTGIPEKPLRDGSPSAVASDRAGQRLLAYLCRLPMTEPERLKMALDVLADAAGLAEWPDFPERTAMGLLLSRTFAPSPFPDARPTPPVKRTPMAPEFPFLRSRIKRATPAGPPGPPGPPGPAGPAASRGAATAPQCPDRPLERAHLVWTRSARARRLLLIGLVVAPTALADARMAELLPHGGSTPLDGFVVLVRRFDRFAITTERPGDKPERPGVRSAIVYPVYGEDMDRVAAGIEAVHDSLARAGRIGDFDFFILSDTRNPEAWAEEESAWAALRDRLDHKDRGSRIFYRRRRDNTKKKSGNIADFCRRFGACYTYMLVMDADSVMSGTAISRMVSVMERNRRVGILQSVPAVVGRDTILARAQQFSSRLYGPMFTAGFHFWLLGDAQYWGHNALIRLKPFMRHCALPRLSGKPPLGGEIVSHDFVESTLMRRAGWSVWLAYDLPGSYEETPSNLLDELSRDRRWCMGNLQHLRLVFSSGVFTIHRFLFLNGVMAYGSALLWFLFLAVSTSEAIIESLTPEVYFPATRTLFPAWPIWEPWWALSLLLTTGVLLFLPKVFSLLLALLMGRVRLFGGFLRLTGSILLEVVLSSLLAPIRMLFHAKFVFITLLGRTTGWETQSREDKPTPWSEAIRFHLGATLLAALWGTTLYFFNERFFWWVSSIFLPLVLSIPISVAVGMPSAGRLLRRFGLLLIPEEVDPPQELVELGTLHQRNRQTPRALHIPKGQGVALAVVDPATCGLRLGLMRHRKSAGALGEKTLMDLVDKATGLGPAGLSLGEKSVLLEDPVALAALHRSVWLSPAEQMRSLWFADISY